MKFSIILLSVFFIGIIFGLFKIIPPWIISTYPVEDYLLYALLFLIGICIGSDTKTIKSLLKLNMITILIPILVAAGSISGAALSYIFVEIPDIKECMAIGAGFGYYSLSSIIISKLRGEAMGGIALLSNIFREVFTLLFAPLLCKYFSKLALVASGGATSMDTTLPVIHKYSGKEYVLIAIVNGVVLSISVPIIIPLILN